MTKKLRPIILAGGMGTRLSEYTKSIPKPMVKINNVPIIIHIMKHYAKYGFKDFLIATGYKSKIIQNFFKRKILDWNIKIVNTGKKSISESLNLILEFVEKNYKFSN